MQNDIDAYSCTVCNFEICEYLVSTQMITCHCNYFNVPHQSTAIIQAILPYLLDACGRGGTCHFLGCFRSLLIIVKFGQKGSCTWDPVVVCNLVYCCIILYRYIQGVYDKPSNQDPYEPISISWNITNPSVACWKYHPDLSCQIRNEGTIQRWYFLSWR